jgi:hypothetical protein
VRRYGWLLISLAIAGCGSNDAPGPVAQTTAPREPQHVRLPSGRECDLAGRASPARDFRTCWGPSPNHPNPTIERRTPSGWKLVTGPLEPPAIDAMWGRVWVSPDRRTLLAEWRYPCDSGTVIFVGARGGRPRVVTGQADWRKAPVSQGIGWTPDGKARVHVSRPWRGHAAGIYLFDPRTPAGDARPLAQPGC